MQNLLGFIGTTHNIRRIAAFCLFHAFDIGYCFHIFLSKAQGTLYLQVHQLRSFIVSIS